MVAVAVELAERENALQHLEDTIPAEPVDLLVLGDGETETTLAYDAAAVGLRVGLIASGACIRMPRPWPRLVGRAHRGAAPYVATETDVVGQLTRGDDVVGVIIRDPRRGSLANVFATRVVSTEDIPTHTALTTPIT
ncbi:hypothetical protein [Nesterenkonia alba]|uniref:hypothetical protein n=1 Tax=Nesterenkonia alba TaxID=515814 RepID=UPI0003B58D73|nr:hypothetical protein [Nesterenkonia alba]